MAITREAIFASYKRNPARPEEHCCPRGAEIGDAAGRAVWMEDDSCSYCGSLNPDVFMARLEAGTVRLDPTDKTYKVYVHAPAGAEGFRQTYRAEGDPGGDDPSKWVWTTREMRQTKFYFQHLSIEQRKRFVELLNEKKIDFGESGGFYRTPFFIERRPAAVT